MSKFPFGQVVMTTNAENTLDISSVILALNRHISGDWGDVCEEDQKLNDDALKYGDRILSVYKDSLGTKFWIITESDRSCTTILLPEDY